MLTTSTEPVASTARTLADLVHEVARQEPARVAIIFQEHTISYGQLDALIEHGADALAARGVRQGDRVAIMLPNIPHFVIAYYAIARLGAVTVPLNLLYKADEIAYILRDSEATTVIAFEAVYPRVSAAVREAPSASDVIVVTQGGAAPRDTTPWPTSPPFIAGDAPPRVRVEVKPEDLAVICYTSGTTGRTKGAMLTHRNFIANCEQVGQLPNLCARRDDRLLLVLPLFHIFGMNVGLNMSMRVGATIDLMIRFEPIPVLEEIQKNRCTIFLGAPPMYVAWVNTPEFASYDLSSLRVVNSGAAALPHDVLRRFGETTGVRIQEGYGLTETSPVTHSNAAGPAVKPGTIGPPIPGVEARAVDDDDGEVPRGQEGEIVIRGENVTQGYWRMPEATAEALRGGWFHTGDIATVDEDGYYTIVDRKKDMINAGGFKVWPREVEEVLYHHPAVQDAAVVAMPDPYAGERPIAYVVLRPGQAATAEELRAYCQERLATFKAPRRVEFRDELPRLMTGKVLRRALRDEARQLAEQQPTGTGDAAAPAT